MTHQKKLPIFFNTNYSLSQITHQQSTRITDNKSYQSHKLHWYSENANTYKI